MATLYVSYFGGVDKGVAYDPCGSTTVTTSGTSAQTAAAVKGGIAFLFSDAAHYVTVGEDPTAAAANSFYLPASTPFPFKVGYGHKIAAITV